jgi:hypothetical protein
MRRPWPTGGCHAKNKKDFTKKVAFAKKPDNREIFVLTLKMLCIKPP